MTHGQTLRSFIPNRNVLFSARERRKAPAGSGDELTKELNELQSSTMNEGTKGVNRESEEMTNDQYGQSQDRSHKRHVHHHASDQIHCER